MTITVELIGGGPALDSLNESMAHMRQKIAEAFIVPAALLGHPSAEAEFYARARQSTAMLQRQLDQLVETIANDAAFRSRIVALVPKP